MRLARNAALVVVVLLLLHGGVWYVATGLVRARLTQAQADPAARMVELRVGTVERAGYPWAAGVMWRDVEFGPGGLPFGARASTARVALTLVPSLLHAPTYRAELPDPLRITLVNGAVVVFAAADARVEAAWGDPDTATLTATRLTITGLTVATAAQIARVARLRATLRVAARTLVVAAEGIDPPGPASLPPVATASADLALEGPPWPEWTQGGPAMSAALTRWRDGGGVLRIVRATLGWGTVDAEAQGRVTLDPQLQPAATGELTVAGGGEGLQALAASGVVSARAAQAARALLALLPATAKLAGRDAVRLPVALVSGRLGVAGYPLLRLAPLGLP